MIDAVKDYLAPKRFGIVAYICVIVHFLCGLVFTAVTAALRASENGKFSCSVDAKSTATYKKQVDQVCFSRYDQVYNSPLPLYGFVTLSIGLSVLVSVIYSLLVSARVDEIESSHERQTVGEAEHLVHGQNRRIFYVLYRYFIHLVVRLLFGIIFTVVQHTYFYPNGFDLKFSCNLPPAEVTSNINTPKNASRDLNCENATASEKWLWGIIVSVINSIFALVILVEIIYLWRRLPVLNCRPGIGWSCDSEFVTAYFLRKGDDVPGELEISSVNKNLLESIDFYKQQVLNRSCAPDINYIQKTNLDDLYTDVVIHTERSKREFTSLLKRTDRHEIYHVYMEVPSEAIRLEMVKDLFYPNEDTKGKFPRSILAIGRPGIGKTVLTEKILRDWANGIDEYYSDKIVFFFKFRWFNENINKLTNISLKTFLRFGTGLSEEKFESIYEEIAKQPQKAVFIFDGLDEYHGDPISCFDQSRIIPNDPNTGTSAMNLFIKLVLGDLLKGATVLVTSRPTADDFYSRLDFDRNVEIIGFTSDKIEEYVSRFCDNNNTSDLSTKIWNHIKSSSEVLNLCYIPVNCFIVCITLSGCLSTNPRNETDALPTTLTELYQTAVDHFGKHHHRNADRNSTTHEALKKLQRLAFLGMESGQLVFNQKLFDEQMKNSGLLNSLSNPIFPLRTQFCFIHLTIQEFLAARHVTETFARPEIKTFISDHVESGKWHLVLQFIGGLLGMKIKNFERKYKDCVFAFAESLEVTNGKIEVKYHEVFIMKCLREADDEETTKEVCEATGINDLVELEIDCFSLSPSECAAVTFVCKHMEKLTNLKMTSLAADSLPKILGLLRKTCLNKLGMHLNSRGSVPDELDQVFSALTELNCTFDHEHTKLTTLTLEGFALTEAGLPIMCNFFENGHARQLEVLSLFDGSCRLQSSLTSTLCEVFNNGHCPNLTHLKLQYVTIRDESVMLLFDTLTKELRKLNILDLHQSGLTVRCFPTLVKALQDERCQLTDLSLGYNAIGDKGVGMLFEDALTKEHCKLTKLDLEKCSLTDRCIPSLCKALQDERCQLTDLSLWYNAICDKGACMLFEDALIKEHCKLTDLNLHRCWLTDRCIPSLCKALQDERCQLTVLDLGSNAIGDVGACMLFEDALMQEHCKLTELKIVVCSLTDQCIPSLCKALKDGHCVLTILSAFGNNFTENGKKLLRDTMNYESYKARGLEISVS